VAKQIVRDRPLLEQPVCNAANGPVFNLHFCYLCYLETAVYDRDKFCTDDKGERTALLIDFAQLKQEGKSESDVMDFIEDLEDILSVELSKNENNYSSWDDAKKRLRAKEIIP
jgi:hypothetical protein